jgi:hypothetical protein
LEPGSRNMSRELTGSPVPKSVLKAHTNLLIKTGNQADPGDGLDENLGNLDGPAVTK